MLVGIFSPTTSDGGGTAAVSSPASVYPIQHLVESQPGWKCIHLSSDDFSVTSDDDDNHNICCSNGQHVLRRNLMDTLDVLIFPRGEPRQMRNAVTPTVRRWLEDWKQEKLRRQQQRYVGVIGICAGSVVLCGGGRKGISLVDGIRMVDDNRFGSTSLSTMVELQIQTNTWPFQQLKKYFDGHNDTENKKNTEKNHHDEPNDNLKPQHVSPSSMMEGLRMPHVSGPLFSVTMDGDVESNENNTLQRSNRECIWATYKTDAAKQLLPKSSDSNMKNDQDGDNGNVNNSKAQSRGGRHKHNNNNNNNKKNSTWTCSICQTMSLPSKQKKCCGIKRSDHDKQLKLLQQIVGIMPGTGACVSTDNTQYRFRSVLFGPHPEMGDDRCTALLLASMKWVANGNGGDGDSGDGGAV